MKISSRHAADTGEGLIRRSARKAFHLDVCVQNRAADSRGFGARSGLQARQQRENIRLLCRPLVVLCASEGDAHGEDTGRVQTGRILIHPPETFNHEPGSCEQDNCCGDFGDHKKATDIDTAGGPRHTVITVFEGTVHAA